MRMKIARIGRQSAPAVFRKAAACAFLLWVAIGCISGASAGDTPGWVIHLSVVDETNQASPDAAIEVLLGEKLVTTSSTDAEGKATLTVNLPGTYSLKISKTGSLATETTLEVREGNAAREIDVDVVLSTAALSQQRVEVRGEASNPITETSSAPNTLSPEQAKDT